MRALRRVWKVKRRDFIASLAPLPIAACGGRTPAYATTRLVVNETVYIDQALWAEKWLREEHARLIEDGFKWDGMDGYYK